MRLVVFIFCFVWSAAAAFAEGARVALVIGNSQYQTVSSLKNPERDAQDIASALDRLGFEVTTALNLGHAQMGRAVGTFARKAAQADMAVIYYAGHGVEVDGRNFLLPTDANITHSIDLDYQALGMQTLLRSVEGADTLRLVFLDACRDNPFGAQFAQATRSVGRGLGEIEPPNGIVVSYAARGGTVAYDGEGENSPYASALLDHLETPGLELGKVFRKVRDSVLKETGGLQEPFTYGSLSSTDVFLAGRAVVPSAVSDFAAAQALDTIEAWDTFVEQYEKDESQTALVVAARRLRTDLLPPEPVPAPVAPVENSQPEPPLEPIVLDLPAVTPEAIEDRLALSTEQMRQIQTLFNALGYDTGTPDGVFGRRSRAAIEQFQTDESFTPTGYLDRRVVLRLRERFEEAPANLDGEWELALMRSGAADTQGGFNNRTDTMALVRLEITGRRVDITSVSDLTSVRNAQPVGLRANLTTSGRLELSYVINPDFFKKVATRRVAASITLPDRVPFDQIFEARGGRLNGKYGSKVVLRRLDPNRKKEIWE